MDSKLLRANRRQVAVALKRLGSLMSIRRPDGTAVENDYGKVEDGDLDYDDAGEAYGRRTYWSESDYPSVAVSSAGDLNTDEPIIITQADADLEEDDRIDFPDGDTYNVDRVIPFGSHQYIQVTYING